MRASPVPVGLIGAGKHGARYLRHLVDDVPELRVALLSRRDAGEGRRQAESAGARFVADFRELVSSPEIEAVIAVVPPVLHGEICTRAAASGKAILVEKPLAPTTAAAREIVEAVDRAGVPAMIAHTLRFNGVVRELLSRIDEIGPVAQVCLSQRFEPSPLTWLDDPAVSGGGIILHTGVHSFDLVRLFTRADPASAFATTARIATRRTEDNFAAVFRFDHPLTASVAGSRSTASRSGAIEISGARGQLRGDHHHGTAELVQESRCTPLDPGPGVPTVRETLRAFARMLMTSAESPIPLREGLWSVAMAEACARSAASGRAEPVDGAH